MLTRTLNRSIARSMTISKMYRPTGVTCFCGCKNGLHCQFQNKSLHQMTRRNFQGHLGLDSSTLIPLEFKEADQVQLWKDVKAKQDNALVLKSTEEIETYVLSMVKNYFRTTKKAAVTLEAGLEAHGLDSLDVIELVIQVEDELGYLIDAEKLELFKKPKHFVNYIVQMEAYKAEAGRMPEDGIHEDFGIKKHFPGLPSMGH